jgi:hypothetical protein
MVGTTRDAVASWECGRNRLSLKFARLIHTSTGAAVAPLLNGNDVPLSMFGRRPYSKADFDSWRKRHHEEDPNIALRRARLGAGALEVLFLAAARPGSGKVKERIAAVSQSFLEWCEQTREDFKLANQIDEVLSQRKFKDRLTMTWGDWRKDGSMYAPYYGFKEDKRKPDDEDLTLEIQAWPSWVPGGDMTGRDDVRVIRFPRQVPKHSRLAASPQSSRQARRRQA